MSYADTGSSKQKKAGKTQREIVFGSDAKYVSAESVKMVTRVPGTDLREQAVSMKLS